jgi:hypothetical protein
MAVTIVAFYRGVSVDLTTGDGAVSNTAALPAIGDGELDQSVYLSSADLCPDEFREAEPSRKESSGGNQDDKEIAEL